MENDIRPPGQHVHLTFLKADTNTANALAAVISESGIGVTFSQAGGSLTEIDESRAALDVRNASALIVLCSEASLRDRRVRQHLHLAWRYERPIIPVLLRPMLIPDDVAYWLEGTQWIEFFRSPDVWKPELARALSAFGLNLWPIGTQSEASRFERTAIHLPHSKIPFSTGRLIGRETELDELHMQLAHHRLVTIVGSGGTGKTRLAIELARNLRPQFPDGVFFVELVPLTDPELVPKAVGRELGIESYSGETMADAVARGLEARRILLVLDNFEHVLAAAEFVARLLHDCPEVSILVTSRAPLAIPGETTFELNPLKLPRPESSDESLSLNAAVQFFVQRASDIRPGFSLTPGNARDVAALCTALDGLPLSLELMAGKARVLTPAQMLKRFAVPTDILSIEGNAGAADHQRSLRKTIEWSVQLLTPEQRRAFTWMGAFSGSAALETIEEIFNSSSLSDRPEALSAIESLIEQHLMTRIEGREGEARFSMLTSIRAFARELFADLDEATEIRKAHSSYFLGLLAIAGQALTGPDQANWLVRLDDEHADCQAAMEWAFETEPSQLLDAVNGLWLYWTKHGGLREGLLWIERLTNESIERDPEISSKLLNVMGNIACDIGEFDRAQQSFRQCLELAQELKQDLRVAAANVGLGIVSKFRGDYVDARRCHQAALETASELGDDELYATCLDNLADDWAAEGNFVQATTLHKQALDIFSRLGDLGGIAYSYWRLGVAEFHRGRLDSARQYSELSLARFLEIEEFIGASYAQLLKARIEKQTGLPESVQALLRTSLEITTRERLTYHILEAIEAIALHLDCPSHEAQTTQLLAWSEQMRLAVSFQLPAADARAISLRVDALRLNLDPLIFAEAWRAGQMLSLDKAIDIARNALDSQCSA